MEKEKVNDILDIEEILNCKITNVICTFKNEPDIDLFAQAFYDLFYK